MEHLAHGLFTHMVEHSRKHHAVVVLVEVLQHIDRVLVTLDLLNLRDSFCGTREQLAEVGVLLQISQRLVERHVGRGFPFISRELVNHA